MMLAGADKTGAPSHWRTLPQTRSVTAYCKAPTGWLLVADDGSIHFRPLRSARYAKIMCVANRMKALHIGPVAYLSG